MNLNCSGTALKQTLNCSEIALSNNLSRNKSITSLSAMKVLWTETALNLLFREWTVRNRRNALEWVRNWFKLLWNCSKCALKLLWKYTGNQLEDYFQIAIKIVLKLLWNCSENRFGRELGSALKLLRNCSETDFELLWNGCAIVLKINLQIHLTWLRNCSETALKLLWNQLCRQSTVQQLRSDQQPLK